MKLKREEMKKQSSSNPQVNELTEEGPHTSLWHNKISNGKGCWKSSTRMRILKIQETHPSDYQKGYGPEAYNAEKEEQRSTLYPIRKHKRYYV